MADPTPQSGVRPSTSSKKDLLRSYRTNVDAKRTESKATLRRKTVVKEVFRIIIAIFLSATTLTSMLQFSEESVQRIYQIIIVVSSIGSSVLTSIYGVLDLENTIVKTDKTARSCESLLLEIDKLLYTSKPIEDSEIDSLIVNINGIIASGAVAATTDSVVVKKQKTESKANV